MKTKLAILHTMSVIIEKCATKKDTPISGSKIAVLMVGYQTLKLLCKTLGEDYTDVEENITSSYLMATYVLKEEGIDVY